MHTKIRVFWKEVNEFNLCHINKLLTNGEFLDEKNKDVEKDNIQI